MKPAQTSLVVWMCLIGVGVSMHIAVAMPRATLVSANDHFVDATVCDLFSKAKEFNGKSVRVRATVDSDGIENTLLRDETCPQGGIGLWTPEDVEHRKWTARALKDAIFRMGLRGTDKNKTINGTFLGTFSLKDGPEFPERVLRLDDVPDLTIHISSAEPATR